MHALVLSDDKHSIAVALYFMNPVRPRRDLLAGRRQAELVRMQLRQAWVREYASLTVFSERLGAEDGPMRIALPYLGIGVCLSLATWLALGLVL